MEELRKIGWFFTYWVTIIVGVYVVFGGVRLILYRTWYEAVHFDPQGGLLIMVIAGFVAAGLLQEKYKEQSKSGN